MGSSQSRYVSALAVIFPGVPYKELSVRAEVDVALGSVGIVKAAAVYAERYADTVFDLSVGSGILFSHSGLCSQVVRSGLVEEVLFAVDIRSASVGSTGIVLLLVAVHRTHLERVDAHLRSQAVNCYIGAHEGLR